MTVVHVFTRHRSGSKSPYFLQIYPCPPSRAISLPRYWVCCAARGRWRDWRPLHPRSAPQCHHARRQSQTRSCTTGTNEGCRGDPSSPGPASSPSTSGHLWLGMRSSDTLVPHPQLRSRLLLWACSGEKPHKAGRPPRVLKGPFHIPRPKGISSTAGPGNGWCLGLAVRFHGEVQWASTQDIRGAMKASVETRSGTRYSNGQSGRTRIHVYCTCRLVCAGAPDAHPAPSRTPKKRAQKSARAAAFFVMRQEGGTPRPPHSISRP